MKNNQEQIVVDDFQPDDLLALARMGSIPRLSSYLEGSSATLAPFLERVMGRWEDPEVMFLDIRQSTPCNIQRGRHRFLLLYIARSRFEREVHLDGDWISYCTYVRKLTIESLSELEHSLLLYESYKKFWNNPYIYVGGGEDENDKKNSGKSKVDGRQ